MSGLTIRFDFTLSPTLTRCGLAGLMMLASAPELSSESVTLSTYYPAPSGVYTQMITTGNTFLARDAGNRVSIGTTAAPPAGVVLDINGNMQLSGALPQTLSYGAGASVSAPAANTLVFNTAGAERMRVRDNGFVGIGTNNPLLALDVNGSIVASGCPAPTVMTFNITGPVVTCPAGTYATWARGVMVKIMSANNAYPPTPATATMDCCPCPGGICPAL